jgi:stage IV sporulation protein FB
MIRKLRASMAATGDVERGGLFSIAGMPLRIHPVFWVLLVVLGWPRHSRHGPGALAVWVAVAGISVLCHELGHAWVARRYGVVLGIRLHAAGGLTRWRPLGRVAWWKRAAFVAGGPLASGALAAFAWLLSSTPTSPKWALTVGDLLYVNAAWAVFNLLPVEPLDGGQLLRIMLERRGAKHDGVIAVVALVTVALASILAIGAGQPGVLLPLFMGGIYNLERLQAHREATTHTDWTRPTQDERARDRY